MTEDRYVIVYRDGRVGPLNTKHKSDMELSFKLKFPFDERSRPAYRIRIRETAFRATSLEARPGRDPLNQYPLAPTVRNYGTPRP